MMMMMISLAWPNRTTTVAASGTAPPGSGNIFHQLPSSSSSSLPYCSIAKHRKVQTKMRHQLTNNSRAIYTEEGKVAFFKCFQCRLSSFAGLHPRDICPYLLKLPLRVITDFSRMFHLLTIDLILRCIRTTIPKLKDMSSKRTKRSGQQSCCNANYNCRMKLDQMPKERKVLSKSFSGESIRRENCSKSLRRNFLIKQNL